MTRFIRVLLAMLVITSLSACFPVFVPDGEGHRGGHEREGGWGREHDRGHDHDRGRDYR